MRQGEERLGAFVDNLLREHRAMDCNGNHVKHREEFADHVSTVTRGSMVDDPAMVPGTGVSLVGGPTVLLVTHALLAKCLLRYLLGAYAPPRRVVTDTGRDESDRDHVAPRLA